MKTPIDILDKPTAIRASIAEQVAGLLEAHYEGIVTTAEENFSSEEGQGEIKAKVSFAVTFNPAIQAPKVQVKISYARRYSDESEAVLDREQSKLELVPAVIA
jgi:hypothetical protein